MPITDYAITVAARLDDQVTPPLLRLIETLDRANAIVLDFKANLRGVGTAGGSVARALDRAAAGATALGDASGALTRASYVLDTMAASSADLARNMAAARAEGRGMGGGGALGGVAARSASQGGYHAGIAARSAEGAGVATLGVIGYGVYENAKLDNIVTRAVLTDGVKPAAQAAAVRGYMDRIRVDATKYGFAAHGLADFATSYLSGARLLRGMPSTERMSIMDTILPYAAQEAYLKQISLTDSISAFVGAAHMAGAYTPAAIKSILPALISTSMATNTSLPQIERAAGYAVPILRTGLQIDPAKVFTMLAVMQRAGIQNSKSGTWLADLFMNAVPGNFGAGLFHNTKQAQALRHLGLLDAHNHLTYLDKNGHLDPLKLITQLSAGLEHLPPVARAADMKQAFGTQGARAAALLTDEKVRAMIPLLVDAAMHLESPSVSLHQAQQNNAAARARQVVTNAQLTITNATATFLGPVNAALAAAAPASADAAAFAKGHPLGSLAMAGGGVFATLLAGKSVWGLSKLALRDMSGMVERLVVSAAERATGAEIGGAALGYLAAGSGVIASLGVAVAGAAGYALGNALNWALDEAVKKVSHGKESTLGGWIYDVTHLQHPEHPRTLVQMMSDSMLSPNGPTLSPQAIGDATGWVRHAVPPVQVHTHINLDGREVANVVSWHLLPEKSQSASGLNPHAAPLSPIINHTPGM